jgi:hypothetical protein
MEESFHTTHLPSDKAVKKHEGLIESVLEHIADSTQHLDHQINIVIGISAAIFVLTVSMFEKEHGSVSLFLIMIFAGASALVGLLAVHPPRKMRKRDQPESLLYRKKIESFNSSKEYEKAIMAAAATSEKACEQYAIEIYNLCKYYYGPKRKLFHLSRKLLFAGIALSLIAFLLQNFTGMGN